MTKLSNRPEITVALVRQLLFYEPDTGALTWKKRSAEHFFGTEQKPSDSCKRWNTCNAGKPALQSKNKNGYCHGAIFGQTISAHKVAWAIFHGKWPEHGIDHINGDKLDNRIVNLRDVDGAENSRNMRRNRRNTSGYTGVHLHRPSGKWVASIKGAGKVRNLGYFDNKEAAHAARKMANKKFGFHPNHGRAA